MYIATINIIMTHLSDKFTACLPHAENQTFFNVDVLLQYQTGGDVLIVLTLG